MKRLVASFLIMILLLGLVACGNTGGGGTTEPATNLGVATQADIDHLESLYAGRTPYYGEMHDHSDSGGRSDGNVDLKTWKTVMDSLEMDFAVIVDHKQARHMFLPEWDDTIFVGGTEAQNSVADYAHLESPNFHCNYVFADGDTLMEFLEAVPEFNLQNPDNDPLTAFFPYYPYLSKDRIAEIAQLTREMGGMFVHVHPAHKGYLDSGDPVDYWFLDWTGLEVLNTYKADRNGPNTQSNYKLWRELLYAGKHVWATTGNDEHNLPSDKALSTVYATERKAQSYLASMAVGDFTAGPVGIRMCVGDTLTGSEGAFDGKRLVIAVGDFHKSVADPKHTYSMELYAREEKIFSGPVSCTETTYFAFDAEDHPYYRVVIIDETTDSIIAYGNPIWQAGYTLENEAQ